MKPGLPLVLAFILLSALAHAGGGNCSGNCFKTEVLKAEKKAGGCTEYTFRISHDGTCRYDLSHYTVEVPCGQIKDLSNSENWKQILGRDPKTGLTGFKIDDIRGCGKDSQNSFTVTFTHCPSSSCAESLGCWQPKVAYKAGQCIDYEVVDISCNNLKATLDQKNPTCHGATNGELSVQVESGKEPITYIWSTGETTPTISNLAAGTYSVVVQDASQEEITLQATLTEPDPIQLEGTMTHPTCSGTSNGSIDLTVTGGTVPLTFLWSNSATTEDLNNLPAGHFQVTVKDATQCTVTKTFTLTNTTQLVIAPTIIQPDCSQTNGSVDLTVTGGDEPYTFQWSTGATTEDIAAIGAGIYLVTVADAQGCSLSNTVNVRENNTLALRSTVTPTSCTDDSSGEIDLTVTGGEAPYTFQWSNGATTEDLSNLSGGFYTVTVTDAKGCTRSSSINVPRKTLFVSAVIEQPLCAGEATGSIALTPTTGEAPYTYEWSTGGTGSSIIDLPAGTYTVKITDAAGCSRTFSYIISSPQALTATATVKQSECRNEESFQIDLTITGGTGPYSYSWSNGSLTEDLEGLTPGTYSVTVTDANGCMLEKEIRIESTEPWSCSITSIDAVNCGSSGNTLSTPVTDATSYQWSVSSSDNLWVITSGSETASIEFTSGGAGSQATFTLTIQKGDCSQVCTYSVASCIDTGYDDGHDDGDDDGDGDDGDGDDDDDDDDDKICKNCFDTEIELISESGNCKTYTATISTDGSCRYELSHWTLALPCGLAKEYSNSEGWKMEIGKDPTTGLTGLKVDDIHSFGKIPDTFTVTFTLCGNCDAPDKVAYKAGQCVLYDHSKSDRACRLDVYPNPFHSEVNFTWTADTDEEVILEMIDPYTNEITEVFRGQVRKGQTYGMEWKPGTALDRIYYYRYRGSRNSFTGKVLKR